MGALPEDTEETKHKAKETTLFGGGENQKENQRTEGTGKDGWNKRWTTPQMSTEPGPKQPLSFFGEGHPCKIRWQEPQASTAVPSTASTQVPKKGPKEEQVSTNKLLIHTQPMSLHLLINVFSPYLVCCSF